MKSKNIRFETKEESNARRLAEFLALSPHERFMLFLKGFARAEGDAVIPLEKKDNFILERPHGIRR
jgi:hypothetical protein